MTADNDPPNETPERDSLFDSLVRLTGQVAGGTLDLARSTATMTAMFGESWLRNALLNTLEPERMEAMAEAGRFLRDARETAGLSLKELAERLELRDKAILEEVESGATIMPLEMMLRSAALLARHDPVPFLLKFMRTYNPQLENTLEQWGVMALPRQYERERRFVNLYRKHDALRAFSDEQHERFIRYMESSCDLVLDVMRQEQAAHLPAADGKAGDKLAKSSGKRRAKASPKAPPRASRKTPPKKAAGGRAGSAARKSGKGKKQ